MKKTWLLYVLLLIGSFCKAQDSTGVLYNLRYLLETGDTTKAINDLESFEKKYPTNFLVYFTNDFLSDLYFRNGQLEKAQLKRLHILDFKPTDFSIAANGQSYKFLTQRQYYSTLKATICIKISEMYMALNERDSSIKYLNLADDKFLPYKDCGNGILMYRSFLSFKFCNHYLKFGDTSSAIQRLLHYFLEPDGDASAVTKRLRELLLTRYNPNEINAEIHRAIATSRLVTTEPYSKYIEFVLFGETLHLYYDDKLRPKRQLRMNRFISLLAG